MNSSRRKRARSGVSRCRNADRFPPAQKGRNFPIKRKPASQTAVLESLGDVLFHSRVEAQPAEAASSPFSLTEFLTSSIASCFPDRISPSAFCQGLAKKPSRPAKSAVQEANSPVIMQSMDTKSKNVSARSDLLSAHSPRACITLPFLLCRHEQYLTYHPCAPLSIWAVRFSSIKRPHQFLTAGTVTAVVG